MAVTKSRTVKKKRHHPSSQKDAQSTPPPAKRKKKDPKESHLYTDDNPTTTLHGTGFKDASAAHKTIELVSQRSLTYQFQTINTMLHRAKGHPHKTSGIDAAIPILQDWVDGYAQRKDEMRKFPLLDKRKVKFYLDRLDQGEFGPRNRPEDSCEHDLQNISASYKSRNAAESFARVYIEMAPRKRLANTLVDDRHPEREDWEVRRYKHLCDLVDSDRILDSSDLWIDERGRVPSERHLWMILWAFSPSKRT